MSKNESIYAGYEDLDYTQDISAQSAPTEVSPGWYTRNSETIATYSLWAAIGFAVGGNSEFSLLALTSSYLAYRKHVNSLNK